MYVCYMYESAEVQVDVHILLELRARSAGKEVINCKDIQNELTNSKQLKYF